jgi:uncharacterized membrane protein HdeD (DUF308 family)
MNSHDLAIGIVCAAVGLFMFLNASFVIGILPFLFGLLLIYGGARSIQTAFDVRRFHGLYWWFHRLVGIFFAIVGIQAILNPFETAQRLTRFIGLGLLLFGVYMFLSGRKVKKLRSDYTSGDDIIDQESVK